LEKTIRGRFNDSISIEWCFIAEENRRILFGHMNNDYVINTNDFSMKKSMLNEVVELNSSNLYT